ncbi:MAG TPA: glycosyltransferase family 4 protein, partial [Woeseiaceae bacterium]|nr:glycosyltransferase family 4 protein [Woeseiaceae bacterium]
PSMAAFILGGIRTGRKLLRCREFDIVNTHFALPSGPVGAALAQAGRLPNVLSVHGGDLYDPTKWLSPHRHGPLRSVVTHIVRRADVVVGQSRNTIENLRRYYDQAPEAQLIPLGIPRPPRTSADREVLGVAADEFVMITIARLVARKGIDQLLTLLRRLDGTNARLVVIGGGPELESLRFQANALGIGSRVTFTGFLTEEKKTEWLAASDLYVSTTQHEGFGLVFLEAMAQGLPVVCYDHGGQTDFLAHGVNAMLLPLNDLDAFEAAVRELASDADTRARIAARNRRDVERYFIEACADRYEELFTEFAGQTHSVVSALRQ